MDSTRRNFIGGTVAGVVSAVIAEAHLTALSDPAEDDAAVFVIAYPPGESLNAHGKVQDNHSIAGELAKKLCHEPERWVVLPAEKWCVYCVPNKPQKILERIGVEYDFENGMPRCNADIWDAHTKKQYHQVTYCNTLTGEITYYKSDQSGSIAIPIIKITEYLRDLRVKCHES